MQLCRVNYAVTLWNVQYFTRHIFVRFGIFCRRTWSSTDAGTWHSLAVPRSTLIPVTVLRMSLSAMMS